MNVVSCIDINNYKQNYLYSEEYKACAIKHHSVKIFGEPVNCINDTFLINSLETLEGSHLSASSPDLTHLIRVMSFDDEIVKRIEITSNMKGQIIRVEAKLSNTIDIDEMREISRKINKQYGQPSVTPPNPQFPLWGWKTNDGFDIRLFRDTSVNQNIISITHKDAYLTLRDIRDKEFKNDFNN